MQLWVVEGDGAVVAANKVLVLVLLLVFALLDLFFVTLSLLMLPRFVVFPSFLVVVVVVVVVQREAVLCGIINKNTYISLEKSSR